MPIFSFQSLRIFLLLMALAFFGWSTLHQTMYTRSWNIPINVVIFPINIDADEDVQRYINRLTHSHVSDIDDWMAREGKRYNTLIKRPTKTTLAPQLYQIPPKLPAKTEGFPAIIWGLKMRWWVWRNTPKDLLDWRTIKIYAVLYPESRKSEITHSVGLQRGLIGLVHAVGEEKYTNQNNIVIAHEMLHTVGASDKYDRYGLPVYPDGFGNPHRKPLYPQRVAEIMAGRIAVSSSNAYMAFSLKSTKMGVKTAREINWLSPEE